MSTDSRLFKAVNPRTYDSVPQFRLSSSPRQGPTASQTSPHYDGWRPSFLKRPAERAAAIGFTLLLVAVCSRTAFAADIAATVQSATAEYATVTTEGDMPRPGDNAEIFFQIPGVDADVSVAKGHVYEITGHNIVIQIDHATGKVAAGQKVRLTSNSTSTPSPPPVHATTPSPVQATAPPTVQSETPPPVQTETPPAIEYNHPTWPRFTPPPTKTKAAATPKPAAPRRIVGTWLGPKHQVRFLADGTVILAPDVPSETKRGVWHLDGDQLVYRMSDGKRKVFRVASYSGNEMVLVDQQGGARRHTRIGR